MGATQPPPESSGFLGVSEQIAIEDPGLEFHDQECKKDIHGCKEKYSHCPRQFMSEELHCCELTEQGLFHYLGLVRAALPGKNHYRFTGKIETQQVSRSQLDAPALFLRTPRHYSQP